MPKPAAKAKKAPARKDAAREKAALLKQKEREKKEREREKAAALKEKEREKKEREREKAAALKEKEREKKEREREKVAALKLKEREQAQKEKSGSVSRPRRKSSRPSSAPRRKRRRSACSPSVRPKKRPPVRPKKTRRRASRPRKRPRRRASSPSVRPKKRPFARPKKKSAHAARPSERPTARQRRPSESVSAPNVKPPVACARARRHAPARTLSARVCESDHRVSITPPQFRISRAPRAGTSRYLSASSVSVTSIRRLLPRRFRPPSAAPCPARARATAEIAPEPLPEATDDGSQPVQGEARPTPPPPALVEAIDERYRLINERLAKVDESFRRQYEESFEMSWIHHDSALEGVVYTFQELKTAMDPTVTVVPDSSMQPVCEEIRRHRQAIAYVRELGERKRVPINVDVIKKLYVILHPEEGDVKTVKYRKDIPQHRLYFHEYAPPDKIAYRVRQAIDWLNGPEPKKIKNPIRIAARVHFDLVRTFPFPNDSGKVARLLMNVLLLRAGYPPAIIHSTERQRYYEALKGQLPIIVMLVNESITNALMSIEKLLDEYEARV